MTVSAVSLLRTCAPMGLTALNAASACSAFLTMVGVTFLPWLPKVA